MPGLLNRAAARLAERAKPTAFAMPLAQRSRGAFYTLRIPEFRVAGRDGTFAAEILDIFNADVES